MPHATEAELTQVKQRASSVSVGYNVSATAIKFVAALLTGSVGLMGEAVHSLTDIVASLFAYFSIRAAAAPPDDDHPYGHGKIESFAALAEAVFLIFIVGFIGYAFLVGRYVAEIGRRTGSLALQSNAQHLYVDGWTSVGVLVTLAIVHFTGWSAADGILGIGIAVWLGYSSWKMLRESFEQLIDRPLLGIPALSHRALEVGSVHQHFLDGEGANQRIKLLHKPGVSLQEGPGGNTASEADIALNVPCCLAAREDVQEGLGSGAGEGTGSRSSSLI